MSEDQEDFVKISFWEHGVEKGCIYQTKKRYEEEQKQLSILTKHQYDAEAWRSLYKKDK